MKGNMQKEQQAQEQIKFLSGLIKHISQPMIIASEDKLLCLWNTAFSKLTGYTDKELRDPIISAGLTAPEWHEGETKALKELQHTGQTQTFQKEYIRKDGTRVPVEVLVYQVTGDEDKGKYYVGLIKDITERKQLEEELQKSEKHYRILVENAIEGIVVTQDGNIKFVNPIVAIGSGYSIEELQSMSLKDLVFSGNEEAILEELNKAAVPGTLRIAPPFRIRTKGGEIRWIEATTTSIMWDDKPANLNLLRDITERNQTEEVLTKSEGKYRTILDEIEEGYYETDLSGNYTFFNDAISKKLGYSREELMGANFQIHTDPEDAQKITEAYTEIYRTGKPLKWFSPPQIRKDGTRIFAEDWVSLLRDDQGEVVGFRGISRDITDRMQAEEALKQSEERYRTILEDMREGYWEVDLAGNFTSFNDAVCRLLGYSKKELMGMSYRAHTNAEDVDMVYQAFNKVYRTGKPVHNMQYEIIQKDGGKRSAETSVFPRQNDKGDIIGFRGVSHDVTERLQMEESLRHSEEKYRTIMDETHDDYFEVDLKGNYVFVNDAFCHSSGSTREEIIGQSYRLFLPEDESKKFYEVFRQIYLTGQPAHGLIYKFIRKNGSSGIGEISAFPMRNESGEIVGFRGVSHDVTQRVQMEEALRQSEEKYRTILEEMQEAYYEEDLSGNFIYVNNALCRDLGYSSEELMGLNYHAYVAPEEIDRVFQAYNQVYLTGEPIPLFRTQYIRKDGNRIYSEISISLLHDKTGKAIGFRGVGREITKHLEAEKALRQSEEKYRNVLENMEESYYEVDLAGNFTFFNDALRRGLDYSKEELIGMNYRVYTPPENINEVFQAYNNVYRTGEPATMFPMEQIRKDGTRLVVENSIFPIFNENGEITGFRGVGRDVTERIEAEKALQQSEERYRTILEEMEEAYFEIDLAGNYTFINDAECRLLGYSREELMGMNYKVYTPPERAKETFEIYNRIYRTGEPNRLFLSEQIRKDGTRIPVEYSAFPRRNEKGEIIGFKGVGRDITERVQMTEALRKSEGRYRTAMEDMQEAYYELDLAGNYTFFNEALCRQLGYSREELMGMNYRTYTPPEEVERVFQTFNQIYRTGKPVRSFAMERIRKDGTRVSTETSGFPLRDMDGEIIGFRGVIRDVTERKRAEEERKELEQKAQLASRLASIGELASGVAHEINNPLTGVIGYAHLLLARNDIPKDMIRDVEVINEGAQRVSNIVKKLLVFARQAKPEQRYININELIGNTLELQTYALAANNIKVSLQLARDLPLTIADPGQLQQVFLNLIMNAETEMKSTHKNGRLLIKTEHEDGTIRISFKDNGPGIKKENLDNIFNPFFTTREVGQGTGLGLSVCHGIITEHKGRIWAESEPGKGATFIIELPIVTEDRLSETTEPVITEEPKKVHKAKILVVDDEPVVRQLISKVMTEEGHEVETVDNAADALTMVKNKRYRLILLDIKMPGMSGIELYKQFQKIAPSLTKRIVFITGDVMGKRTMDFLDKTKAVCVMKPFDAKQLKTEIKRILARR